MEQTFSAFVDPSEWGSLTTLLESIREGLSSREKRPILNFQVHMPWTFSWANVSDEGDDRKQFFPILEDAGLHFIRGRVTRTNLGMERKIRGSSGSTSRSKPMEVIAVDCGVRMIMSVNSNSLRAMRVRVGSQVEGVGVLIVHFILGHESVKLGDRGGVIGINELRPVTLAGTTQIFRRLRFELKPANGS